jgi:hypothetical protein
LETVGKARRATHNDSRNGGFFGIRRIEKYHSGAVRIAIDPTMTQLLRDISSGIRVFCSRDGVVLSEGQILERARNIVMGLVGNYRIEALERGDERSAEIDSGGASGWDQRAATGPA